MKVIKVLAYVNNVEMSRHAMNRVSSKYPRRHIYDADTLPEGAKIVESVTIQCWGMPSYGFTFFVEVEA
mgnify:CR=1 FL=1|tara:strand:- start:147 stop:353 length:207 start_codon:yes stop_codon:yes gene_type:complete